MQNNSENYYQYDSCTSRGICSINPRTSSLMEIIVLYLKLTAYYGLKLLATGKNNEKIRNLILNTISIMVANPEFSENDFNMITSSFREELPKIIKEYSEISKENNITPDFLKTVINFKETANIADSIKLGEKEFLKRIKSTPKDVLDMYKILFVLAKSICTNVIYIESYGENSDNGYETVLKILDLLKEDEFDREKIKEFIKTASETDNILIKKLRKIQIKRYGEQQRKEVSYSTTKGKAVLVAGSNIRELEYILDCFKDEKIDVYTHDDMILAHTFSGFDKYANLKGHFGQGMENCLLDFSTFPGPIILTKHSLYNVENLYRGLLYTTDFAYSKGVIPIKNWDLGPVIESAKNSRGFKTGKKCEPEFVGYNFNEVNALINKKINSKKYKKIIVFGLLGFSREQKEYFEQMLKLIPKDFLVISVPCCNLKDNVISLNTLSDSHAVTEITDYLFNNTNLPVNVIFPQCDKHTISQIINIASLKKAKIFLGKCTPILLNPSLINTLAELFDINEVSSPRKDLEKII